MTYNQEPRRARIIKKVEFCGWGAVVQGIGLLLCLTLVGAIVGIPMLIVGSYMSIKHRCSWCGNPVSDKNVKVCPACRSEF